MNAYMGRERCVMQVVLISESGQFSSLLSLSSSQPLAASCLLLLSLGHYHDSPFPSFLSVLSASMTVPLAPPSYFRPTLANTPDSTFPSLPFSVNTHGNPLPSLFTSSSFPSCALTTFLHCLSRVPHDATRTLLPMQSTFTWVQESKVRETSVLLPPLTVQVKHETKLVDNTY